MMSTNNLQFGERQQQILNATLGLVATEGLLNTSISKISKQANASPGIVYHYFESKDEIMDTLFTNIFSEMMAYILEGIAQEQLVLERYKRLWIRKYYFHINNPDKTIFLEQYKNSSLYTEKQEQATQRMMSGLLEMGQNDIVQGLIANLPLNVLYTMTQTVALNLAKSHIQANLRLEDDILDIIAERVCRSILA